MRGIEHPEAKLSQQQVENLTKDLQETNLNYVELAKKYGFSSNTSIVEFNNGETYVRNIDYPIRKDFHNGKLNNYDITIIINLLKYTYRSFEDIGKQFNVEARTISRINKGILHKQDNEEYPIRESKPTASTPKLTYEDVSDIINLLLYTKLSLRKIARRFDVNYEDILNIKNGTTKLYRRKNLNYPLRPNN